MVKSLDNSDSIALAASSKLLPNSPKTMQELPDLSASQIFAISGAIDTLEAWLGLSTLLTFLYLD